MIYKTICNVLKGGRTFVCGDLHGEITKFNQKLIAIDFDKEKDLMISVGDLIDRGEDSVACLRLINEPWFTCVRGNHEQMSIDALKYAHINNNRKEHWLMNGGSWYYNLDQTKINEVDKLISELEELPLIIETEVGGKKYIICHANYNKDIYEFDSRIHEESVIWDRSRYNDSKAGWTDEIEGADVFIFGHTPVDKVETYKNQMYIDTGVVFNGELTVVEL